MPVPRGSRNAPCWRGMSSPTPFAPTLTLVGLSLGHLLGGIAVIETVFTLPGLGRLMVDSVLARGLSGGAGVPAVHRRHLCRRESGG